MILLHLANLKPKTIRTLMIAKQRLCLACTATQDALEDQIKHVLHVLWFNYNPYHLYDPYDSRQYTITVPSKHLDGLYMVRRRDGWCPSTTHTLYSRNCIWLWRTALLAILWDNHGYCWCKLHLIIVTCCIKNIWTLMKTDKGMFG